MSEENYQETLFTIACAMWYLACHEQTRPDGQSCAVCGDTGHQAMECHHNKIRSWVQHKAEELHLE